MRILFQDSWLIAVEKPSGLLSQPGLGIDQQDSLIGRMQFIDPELRLVHRLDRDTSGLLLLARGAESLRRCSMPFFSTSSAQALLGSGGWPDEAQCWNDQLPDGSAAEESASIWQESARERQPITMEG